MVNSHPDEREDFNTDMCVALSEKALSVGIKDVAGIDTETESASRRSMIGFFRFDFRIIPENGCEKKYRWADHGEKT
jgi:hypothetical protein